LTQLLEKGALLDTMTSQGVSYINFQQQLAEFKGTYAFASADWPTDFAADAKEQFDRAIVGWDLALRLWDMKIGDKDNPVEPDIYGYRSFVD
jgi:hypothetical protein